MPRTHLAARRRQLRREISALTAGAQRRYPAHLRTAIVSYSRERIKRGWSLTRVSDELGVSHPTLVRFIGEQSVPMRRVRVTESNPQMKSGAALVVRGPAGVIVEGLDVDGVAALLKALS